jgi:hypothetical protein
MSLENDAETIAANTIDANTIDARPLVELIRAQNWKDGGVLLVGEADAVRLVATALRIAEHRGAIDGIERVGAIADQAFAPAAAVAS